jgi:FkbM family methyltransferase
MLKRLAHAAKPILDRFPTLSSALRHIRDSQQLSSPGLETPFGFKLVGNRTMQDGSFEPEETRLVLQLMDRVHVVVDVGANIGYYCCLALRHGKRVIAFEAIWLNARYLLRNLHINGWEAEVHHAAVSNKIGVIDIFGGGTGASLVRGWGGTPEHYRSLVPTTTLDVAIGDRLNGQQALIIIDVEGAEKLVLEGAPCLLRNDPKPLLMVEIIISQEKGTGRNSNLLATFELLWDAGYESFTANDKRRPISRDEIEAIQTGGNDTLGTYNFLFVEAGRRCKFIGGPIESRNQDNRGSG